MEKTDLRDIDEKQLEAWRRRVAIAETLLERESDRLEVETSEDPLEALERDLDLESLKVYTLLYEQEPAGSTPVDLSEIKVEDADGRMVWATSFSPEEKTDSVRLNASVSFRIV